MHVSPTIMDPVQILGDDEMLRMVLLAGVAVAMSLTFAADQADAFGGRGYARRQARHASHYARHHAPAPIVVQRVYVAPVVSYYRAPVVSYYHAPVVDYYRAPVYHHRRVYSSYYGSPYRSYGGVSIDIGW